MLDTLPVSSSRCTCETRDAWRARVYKGSYSAFGGYRFIGSDYSAVACETEDGDCGYSWRTKARYVEELPESDH